MSGELDRGSGPRSLREIANSGSSEGGSFVYDEATMLSLISKWVELADHYQGSLKRTGLGAVAAPGLDFASEGVATSANNSGTAYMRYLEQNYNYCIRQAQLLQNTLDDYLGVEHRSVTDFEKTADQPEAETTGPQPGL